MSRCLTASLSHCLTASLRLTVSLSHCLTASLPVAVAASHCLAVTHTIALHRCLLVRAGIEHKAALRRGTLQPDLIMQNHQSEATPRATVLAPRMGIKVVTAAEQILAVFVGDMSIQFRRAAPPAVQTILHPATSWGNLSVAESALETE